MLKAKILVCTSGKTNCISGPKTVDLMASGGVRIHGAESKDTGVCQR